MSDVKPNGPTAEEMAAAGKRLADLVCARWISMAIGAAAELGFADHLARANAPLSSDELARLAGTHPARTYRLLRALARVGVFEEREGRRFANTATSSLLCSGPHASGRQMARMAVSSFDPLAWAKIAESVRTGESGFKLAFGVGQKEWLSARPDEARFFAETMTSFTGGQGEEINRAYDFSKVGTLVDVGGSEGNLLGSLLALNPHMKGVVLDLPDQVESAPRVLAAYGVADRCEIVGGDFFREVPSGGDAYLLRRTLHNWGDEDGVRILEQVRRASRPGAKLLVVEIMLEHPMLDYGGAFVDLAMMIIDEGGRQRTRQEFEGMMARAGFRFVEEYAVAPTPFSILEGVRE